MKATSGGFFLRMVSTGDLQALPADPSAAAAQSSCGRLILATPSRLLTRRPAQSPCDPWSR